MDSGVDLYYYGARYYDANIGRFISADTIVQSLANPQTLNRYSYVVNNPVRFTDPSGHCVLACVGDLIVVTVLAVAFIYYAERFGDALANELALSARKRNGGEAGYRKHTGRIPGSSGNPGSGFGATEANPGPGGPAPDLETAATIITYAAATVVVATSVAGKLHEAMEGNGTVSQEPGHDKPRTPVETGSQAGAGASGLGSEAGRGAGVIGAITPSGGTLSGGPYGRGTDEASNSLFLVSIEGESPIWVTSDNAKSMISNG